MSKEASAAAIQARMHESHWGKRLESRISPFGINRAALFLNAAEYFLGYSKIEDKPERYRDHGLHRVLEKENPLEFNTREQEMLKILPVIATWIDSVPKVKKYMREPGNEPAVVMSIASDLFPNGSPLREKIEVASFYLYDQFSHVGKAFQVIRAMAEIDEYMAADNISGIRRIRGGERYLQSREKKAQSAVLYLRSQFEEYGEIIDPFFLARSFFPVRMTPRDNEKERKVLSGAAALV